jgi:signal transduction histidine kinase
LQFEVTALSFGAPENVHFQYQLEGFDFGWIEAGMQHSISYSRLAAGDYTFRVRACNGDGVWNETGAALALSVMPFFWQTWWFRLVSIPLAALIVIFIVRHILIRRIRLRLRALEQETALERERSRIAKDIHDDLGGSLTQIKLLFELAQLKRQQPDKVDALGQEGLVATRRILKSLDEIVWAVNPRNDSLPHLIEYIGQFAVEFLNRANIRCRVDLPSNPPDWDLSPEARHNLFLVVKEALNNIVRHAHAVEVWLRIKVVDEFLHITIEDDGRGFATAPDNGSADGLINIQQRMRDIGGQSRIESQTGTGTRVSLIFPRPHER